MFDWIPTEVLALIIIALIFVVVVLLILVRRARIRSASEPSPIMARVADARLEPDERLSSIVAEQIEEMVKRKLAQYPDLANLSIDFGTMSDGTIDIWLDDQQYNDPEEIPDQRIREAIKAAVAEFNR